MHPVALLRVTGASMRLTRAVITDDIGEWWVKYPIDVAMRRYQTEHEKTVGGSSVGMWPTTEEIVFDPPWWWKYRDGLDCAHCVGFWIGALVLAGEAIAEHSPKPIRAAWKLATAALALNVVTAHGGDMLDYYDAGEDE